MVPKGGHALPFSARRQGDSGIMVTGIIHIAIGQMKGWNNWQTSFMQDLSMP
jgi:hypothetical protein